MKKRLCIIVLASPVMAVQADTTIDDLNFRLQMQQQQLDERQLFLQNQSESHISPTLVSSTCLPAPLPTTPRTPNYSMTFSEYNGTAKLVFWREPCQDGTGTALMMQATPTTGTPFLCGSVATIIQDGQQLNNIIFRIGSNGVSWCANLLIKTALIVDDGSSLKPAKALTLIYSPINGSSARLDIPASGPIVSSVSGSVAGYKNYSHSCKNTRTGTVKSYASQTKLDWTCKGLSIKAGDTVKTTITGTAK